MKKNKFINGKTAYSSMIILFIFILTSEVIAQQLAFPGAEGYGRFTTGGRGGRVIEVTNLNDTGAGSLRDAINASGARTIVFRISGTIYLKSALSIRNGDLTIAGQTAPGDGICIAGYTPSIEASNIIVRYLRFRLGDVNDIEDDAFNGRNQKNIIIDHCSMTWSVDECASFYDNENFTMQWCIIGESLYASVHKKGNHGYGGIQGGWGATFHHNLYVHNTSRNPRFCGARYHTTTAEKEIVDFANNVIYNWGFNSIYGGELGQQNVRANYFKAGPATESDKKNRILNPSTTSVILPDYGKFYVADNYVAGYQSTTEDNWTTGVQGVSEAIKTQVKVNTPFPIADVTTQTAVEAYELVMTNAGANLPRRDLVDTRLISETQLGIATYGGATYKPGPIKNGIIDSQTDVGGWPQLNLGSVPEDSDHDGMPNSWELSHGLNPNDPSDGNVVSQNGYTNLENYLNSITEFPNFIPAPTNLTAELTTSNSVKLTWQDNSSDETGFKIERKTGSGNFTLIQTLGPNVTTMTDSGLPDLTVFQYRIISFNANLQSESSAVEITSLSATSKPLATSNHYPANDENYVNVNSTFSWKAGLNSASFDIYFGSTNPPVFVVNQTGTSYKPADMQMGKKYYWRIDAKNQNGTTLGNVLSFTTKTILAPQKISQWKLDETGSTSIIDSGPFGNNGTIFNSVPNSRVAGISGNAINFDGVDDYAVVPHNGTIDFARGSFTISIWIKTGTLNGNSMYLLHKGSFVQDIQNGKSGNWYGFEIKSNQLRFSIDDNIIKTSATLTNLTELIGQTWVNVVGVRDSVSANIKLFINGVLKADGVPSTVGGITGDISETEPLYIGNSSDKNSTLSGTLDEIRIFNYALTAQQITDLYREFVTAVKEEKLIPKDFSLQQNYPNPFNPSTRIVYLLPRESDVKLEVFDLLGRKIAVLVDQKEPAGTHQVEFNASNLSAGIYYYRLSTAGQRLTKKMLLMK